MWKAGGVAKNLPLTSERSLERAVAQTRTRIIPNPLPQIMTKLLARLCLID